MKITKELVAELESVRTKAGGKLTPAAALKAAKKGTALYAAVDSAGLWNDTKAANLARIEFLRAIIVKVRVSIERADGKPEFIRAYVSLSEDRKTGGGYVSTVEVLQDDAKKAQMLRTALAELRSFKRKYSDLEQLTGIFDLTDEISQELSAAA